MEPATLIAALLVSQASPEITEVAANPLDETSGEFVELYNPGADTLYLAGYSLTDGDALDPLEAWDESSHGAFPHPGAATGTDALPPGGWCLVFELDYASNPVYAIPDGTLIMTTADLSICNGLAASSDPLTLFDPTGTADSNAVSTYGTPVPADDWQDRDDDGADGIPFDPGDGRTVERYPTGAPDQEGSWLQGPAGGTPGAPPQAPPDTVNVMCTGVWSDPEAPASGQPFQLLCAFDCWGTVPPSSGELSLFLDSRGDSLPQAAELLGSWPADQLVPGEADTFSVQTALEAGWYIPSARSEVPEDGAPEDDYQRVPLAVGGGVPAVVTEVLANAGDEDTDEYVEVHYPGPGSLLLPGCMLTDGDALDVLQAWSGPTPSDPHALALPALPAGRTALVLDSEYAQGSQPYDLPESTVVVTTANTTIGNGLTTTDPVLLYHHADSSLSSLMSTYGTPILSDDPLSCDDDGADGIPFDPGDGRGVQRTSPALPDVEWAWEATGPGGTPGWIPQAADSQDLAVVDLTLSPSAPDPGQPVTITATLLNAGLTVLSGGTATFFLDQDADSVPGSGEVLAETAVPQMEPGDTLSLAHTTSLAAGNYLAAALCSHPDDGWPDNDLRRSGLVVGGGTPLVVTEVLCNPEDEDRDEWVEIHFPGPGVFDLAGCRLTDGDALDSLVVMEEGALADPDAAYGRFLPSGGFALVLDSEYPEGTQPYDLPAGTVVLATANTTIGDGLSGTDPVTLYGPGGTSSSHVMSTYGTPLDAEDPEGRDDDGADGIPYDPGEGGSVQRVAPDGPDSEENWHDYAAGPTPGGPPPELFLGPDAEMRRLEAEPPMGGEADLVTLTATVANSGTEPIGQGELTITYYRDFDGDSLPDPEELLFSYQAGAMDPGDSLQVPTQWTGSGGTALLLAIASCQSDSNPENDSVSAVWNRPLDLVINEVMYSPQPGRPEWVELHVCHGAGGADLSAVRFADSRETTSLTDDPMVVQPGGYAVLCSDSAAFGQHWPEVEAPLIQPPQWPTLNNANQPGEAWADDLRLLLPGGQVIDWVPYGDDWGGAAGVSLERITASEAGHSASNWTGCAAGGTPGEANTASESQGGGAFLTVWPDPFSPDGDGIDDLLHIEMGSDASQSTVTARIYNVQGRVVKTLAEQLECGGTLSLQWDGSDRNGSMMPVGRYIVFLRCTPEEGEVREALEVVVLGRRL